MKRKKTKKRSFPLYLQILAGMIIGIIIGLIALQVNGDKFVLNWIQPWGQIFIRLLQLIAIPLVFISLVKGIMGLKDIHTFSKMGGKTILIYVGTTVVAVVFGISVGLLVKPGNLVDQSAVENIQQTYHIQAEEKRAEATQTQEKGPLAFLDDIIPDNMVSAASNNGRMLQVIFIAVFFAIAALAIPSEKTAIIVNFFDGLNAIIFKMVDYIIRLAPYGVAALMAGLMVNFGGDVSIFAALGAYAGTVIVALFILMLVFYPALIKIFTKIPLKKFLKSMRSVQLFAFTTSSSAATLPVTMETVEKELGVSEETASFVLPVGTTINMDGTSCYQAIAVLFIAQVLGIDLSLQQLLTVIGITILSSIGTPAIPGGSFVILSMVLTSVGIPAQGLALILGIDRPLDMVRTAVNVTGDATVAAIVDKK